MYLVLRLVHDPDQEGSWVVGVKEKTGVEGSGVRSRHDVWVKVRSVGL